jgi:hypothetical protein
VEPFLNKTKGNSEVFYGRFFSTTTFEVACTLKDSYYLNFECQKIEIEVNNKPALSTTALNMEIDLTFKREITSSPVKLSRMELQQKIDMSSMHVNFSPSLLNILYQITNFYFKSKYIASVKHLILG